MLILQISALAILAGMIAPLRGQGTVTQTSGPGTMTQRTSDSATSGNRKAVRHRQSARKVIPIETAPPDAPVPASSQQKAADQTLLHQQQEKSESRTHRDPFKRGFYLEEPSRVRTLINGFKMHPGLPRRFLRLVT
jgi:hypothetical protein